MRRLAMRIRRTDASLILNKFLGFLDLLLGSTDDESLPIITLVASIFLDLNKRSRVLLDQANVFAAFSNDDAGPASWNWIFDAVLPLPEQEYKEEDMVMHLHKT